MEMVWSSGVLMELGSRWIVLLRCGRSTVAVKGLEAGELAARGILGEDGQEGRLRGAEGGVLMTSEVLLCNPLGRDRVEVDMEFERDR